MKYLSSLLLVGALGLFVAPVSADFVIKEGRKLNGTLLTVKKTKKYHWGACKRWIGGRVVE